MEAACTTHQPIQHKKTATPQLLPNRVKLLQLVTRRCRDPAVVASVTSTARALSVRRPQRTRRWGRLDRIHSSIGKMAVMGAKEMAPTRPVGRWEGQAYVCMGPRAAVAVGS